MFDVFESDNPKEWNNLVANNPDASAYHFWEYGEALTQTYRYSKHYLVSTQNSEVDGIFPLIHVRSVLFGNRLISLPFCEYGGIVTRMGLKSDVALRVAKLLVNAATELGRTLDVEYLEIREPLALSAILKASGYEQSREYVTLRIDLSKGLEQIWSDLGKKTRNAVRKAVKSGVELEVVRQREQLKAYYELYLQTQKKLGSPPHCYELFENLLNAFSHTNDMRILLARNQTKPIAGIITFSNGKTIYWWNNASDLKYRHLNPTNLLLWKAIEWGAENGYNIMDMGRTRKDTTIYHFKSGWGGQERLLHDLTCFYDSKRRQLQDPSQKRFQYLSRVWGFLPISVAKKLGPRLINGIAL